MGHPNTSQTDNISGEQVVYTYDALNRLASATATSGAWGQSYSYDGFGNLTAQTVTAGSAPSYSASPNPSTNIVGSADANGNNAGPLYISGTYLYPSYDVANRLVSVGYGDTIAYSYAPGNKRVWRGLWSSGTLTTDEVTFWSVSGQKLATYQLSVVGGPVNGSSSAPVLVATQTGTNYYFGRKLIKNAGGYEVADRLGSIGKYYPYGQEKPSATTNGTEKFTGYFRDAETGLDYADQRFHNPGTGRFLTPDPYRAIHGGVANPSNPGSWNLYAYVTGDPVNGTDPTGRDGNGMDCGLAYMTMVCTDGSNPFTGLPNGTALGVDTSAAGTCVDDGGDPCDDGGGSCGVFGSTWCVTDTETSDDSDDDTCDSNDCADDSSSTGSLQGGLGGVGGNSCIDGAAALGGVVGAGLGYVVGGILGGAGGAVGGTFAAPVVGTIGVGIVGGIAGSATGGEIGFVGGAAVGGLLGSIFCATHTSNTTPSNLPTHEKGGARKKASRGPSSHPKYPPRKPPPGWKGPWPPKPGTSWW